MDAPASVHPSDQTLQSYGLGKLDDLLAEAVNNHLADCPACRTRVAEVTSDTFVGRLQEAKVRPATAPAIGSSLAGLSRMESGSSTTPPPPASTLPPGLADHPDYQVLRELGRGGMGVVYLAENRMMGRKEVLKVVSAHLLNRKGVAERFLREIRSAAQLHHPNIVTAYSASKVGESIVFSMQYIEGYDLARLVEKSGPLAVAHACNFVYQAALGLQHAHEHGMVHRDIKPSNLMLTREGSKPIIKVLDFGLAKVTSEGAVDGGLTHEGQMLGTPHYVAPEQTISAHKADIRADIYSLGCTLYCLLTGYPPFDAPSLYELLQAHHSMDAKPLNFVRPEVPAELAAVVAKMLAKEPERRFQTPAEVGKALMPFFKPGANPGARPSPEVSGVEPAASSPQAVGGVSAPAQPATPVTAPAPAPRAPSKPNPKGVAGESLIEFKEPERSTAVVKPEPEVAPTSAPVRRPPWAWASIATGVLLFGLLVASVVIFRTRNGTIVFENLPEQSVVTADGDAFTVDWPDGKGRGRAQITIPPGKHSVQVKLNGVQVSGQEVIVESGGVTRFVVRIEPPSEATDPSVKPNDRSRPIPFDPQKFTITGGEWRVEGDELVQSNTGEAWPCLMFGDDQWSDYDFTCELMRVRGIQAAFLVVRGADQDNNLTFGISAYANGRCQLYATEGGRLRDLLGQNYSIQANKWYTAHVRVQGSRFECSVVDGVKEVVYVATKNDLRPRGRVGLRTWKGTAYRFRNIKVTAPDGQTLWEGPPAIESPRPGGPAAPKPITNSIGMSLTLIPSGEFFMGSPDDAVEAAKEEKPSHRVRITKPFYLGVYEVTQAQYEAVMGNNPSHFSANGGGKDRVAGQSTGRYPVENVSWLDAIQFSNKLSEKEGKKLFYKIDGPDVRVPDWNGQGYRLPTEAEWEYACRANASPPTRFSFGDNVVELGLYGWFDGNSEQRAHPVSQKRPNGFGLYDMHGNVWEWCWDCYGEGYYNQSPVDDPAGPAGAALRVLRGGSWAHDPRYCRSAHRYRRTPGLRYRYLGFRLALVQSGR